MSRIYLDYAATAPIPRSWWPELTQWLQEYQANPSSFHQDGQKARGLMAQVAYALCKHLPTPEAASWWQWVFTSGATEANNLVLRGLLSRLSSQTPKGKKVVLASELEHPSVLNVLRRWGPVYGFELKMIPVNPDQGFDPEFWYRNLNSQVALVCLNWAHSETGLRWPVAQLAQEAKRQGVWVFSDVTQVFVKFPLEPAPVDVLTFSGHKFHAFKGMGGVYLAEDVPFEPLILGGSQQRHRRAGTENLPGLVSLKWALDFWASYQPIFENQVRKLRDLWESGLKQSFGDEVQITFENAPRWPHISHVYFKRIVDPAFLMKLDLEGFSLSGGVTCSSGLLLRSPFSQKFYTDPGVVLRLSFGIENTEDQVLSLLKVIRRLYDRFATGLNRHEFKAHSQSNPANGDRAIPPGSSP